MKKSNVKVKKDLAKVLHKLNKQMTKSKRTNIQNERDIWYDEGVEPKSPDSVYKNVDADEFPLGQYVIKRVGSPVSAVFSSPNTSHSILCHHPIDIYHIVNKFGFKRIYATEHYDEDELTVMARFVYEVVSDDGKSIVILSAGHMPNDTDSKNKKLNKTRVRAGLIGAGDTTLYETVKKELIGRYQKVKHESNNVNLVIASSHGYDTQEFDLPKQKIDIGLNYGDDFMPVHKRIIESLNRPKSKGLVLLHGDPGTGKTHYLKYIASKVKDKKVLFIPPYLADFITSPEMTPFLIENSNSVLFIEDAERVITDRNESGGNGVSNILNITDGILSDILNIQIVATFNMDKKRIDSALLRKGRLIAEHKFDKLSVDDSNRLLEHLGQTYRTTKEMTLTEIYNLKEDHYVSEEVVEPRRIGFGVR